MRNLLNSKWLFLINTLPILLLFFLLYGQFNIIKSLLNEESILLWQQFGWTLGILGVLNFVYGIYLTVKRKNISIIYSIVALLVYIPFIYLYVLNVDDIVPSSIPDWMISGNVFLYVGTFLMPTLAYAIVILVYYFTSKQKEYKAWKSFSIALAIPISIYLLAQIVQPLWQIVDSDFETHSILIVIITATVAFLLFLVRGIYILFSKNASRWKSYQLVWKIPVTFIFPLLGLLLNNGELLDDFSDSGLFGDFTSPWYYVLATLSGLLLCLPNTEKRLYRSLLFIGRSITFAYTLYFFFVFLPFLPVSVIAILAFGAGFLMLAPLAVFVVHVAQLSQDINYLKAHLLARNVYLILALSLMVLPISLTAKYLQDKATLNEALEYIYTPDYSKHYNVDQESLQKTIAVVNHHKDGNSGRIFGTQTPYLSTYFNWLVLDNLMLSDAKINTIESVFYGDETENKHFDNIQNADVNISNITTESTFDDNQDAYVSWINLEITNGDEERWISEYATTIDLPEGCWISDYYLYVGDKKEYGILTEKKTAMWVFASIRNENRDPGILYYLTGNKVAFRVFPFGKSEVRRTGIQLVHKDNVSITIDGNQLHLGGDAPSANVDADHSDVSFVSAAQKERLPKVRRTPYFHFIFDASKADKVDEQMLRMEQFVTQNKAYANNAKISLVNTYTSTYDLDEDWKGALASHSFDGGYYLERAIKTTLFDAYNASENSYPILVAVTDDIYEAICEKDFADWQFAFPESTVFYNLQHNGDLLSHSLLSRPLWALHDKVSFQNNTPVLMYTQGEQTVYLPDNGQPSIVLKSNNVEIAESDIKEKSWRTALLMQGKWRSQILYPELPQSEWLNLVRTSFKSRIMTPVTSYLVVENEAQKAILKKKQAQVLASNKSLDIGEEAVRMSEPNALIVCLLLGLYLLYKEKRKKKLRTRNSL